MDVSAVITDPSSLYLEWREYLDDVPARMDDREGVEASVEQHPLARDFEPKTNRSLDLRLSFFNGFATMPSCSCAFNISIEFG